MKKGLIALLILSLSFGIVGCKANAMEPKDEKVISEESSKEEKKKSSDEMYELYNSKLNDVEKLFKENNIDFREKSSNKNKKYDGKISIAYENSDIDEINQFPIGRYGILFDEDGEIEYISAKMTMNVNDEDMKTKEFKFEDTEFYKLHNILNPNAKNIDEINKKVNDTYKDLISTEVIEIEIENIRERIVLGDNMIDYVIVINP